ncbi:sigma factor [Cryobacterium sp. N19]|uniref:sigma factor n=1 Tax=Cryobacterium sp. N19 TaxID=2048288 RepID=UPI000CE3A832|nr:sigma factor [Cryobacterium sp. N19]
MAEDAVQDASIRALQTWPGTGIPPNPRAWLIVTGKHRAIDLLRREGSRFAKEREAALMELQQAPDDFPIGVLRDDQLRLIFTCCHPALAAQAQVLEALVAVDALHGLDDYFWLHATRAELLRRLGRESEAAVAATRARGLTDSPAQQRLLEHRYPGRATR